MNELDTYMTDVKLAMNAVKGRIIIDEDQIPLVITKCIAENIKPKLLSECVLERLGDSLDHKIRMGRIYVGARWWLENRCIMNYYSEKKEEAKKAEKEEKKDKKKPYENTKRVLATVGEEEGHDAKKARSNICYGCGNATEPFHRKSDCPCKDMEGFNKGMGPPPVPPLKLPSDCELKISKEKKDKKEKKR